MSVMSNCERLRPVQAIHNAGLWAAHVSRGKLGHAFVLCTNWGDNPDAILGNSLNFSAVNHTDLAHAARCMGYRRRRPALEPALEPASLSCADARLLCDY